MWTFRQEIARGALKNHVGVLGLGFKSLDQFSGNEGLGLRP